MSSIFWQTWDRARREICPPCWLLQLIFSRHSPRNPATPGAYEQSLTSPACLLPAHQWWTLWDARPLWLQISALTFFALFDATPDVFNSFFVAVISSFPILHKLFGNFALLPFAHARCIAPGAFKGVLHLFARVYASAPLVQPYFYIANICFKTLLPELDLFGEIVNLSLQAFGLVTVIGNMIFFVFQRFDLFRHAFDFLTQCPCSELVAIPWRSDSVIAIVVLAAVLVNDSLVLSARILVVGIGNGITTSLGFHGFLGSFPLIERLGCS